MGSRINSMDLWALADALGVSIHHYPSSGKVRGGGSREVNVASLSVSFPVSIVSSCHGKKGVAILARSMGNLAILAVSGALATQDVTIAFIDLLKFKGTPEDYLETNQIDPAHAVKMLEPCLVAVYHRSGHERWMKVV